MVTNKAIINYLSSKSVKSGFIDKLKIKYRPLICPFDILLSFIEDKKSVFDIGCGSGQFCSLVAKFTKVQKIKGVEIQEQLVQNANEISKEFAGKKDLAFSTFNGISLPPDIKDYEIIFLIDVIHHIPQQIQTKFIQEIYNKMGKGSMLVFKDINASNPFVIFNKLHDFVFSGQTGRELKYLEAENIIRAVGFEIQKKFKTTKLLYPHYFFIGIK